MSPTKPLFYDGYGFVRHIDQHRRGSGTERVVWPHPDDPHRTLRQRQMVARAAECGKGHRTMANFYLALLRAVGDKREKFGDPDVALNDIDTAGPLAEILA